MKKKDIILGFRRAIQEAAKRAGDNKFLDKLGDILAVNLSPDDIDKDTRRRKQLWLKHNLGVHRKSAKRNLRIGMTVRLLLDEPTVWASLLVKGKEVGQLIKRIKGFKKRKKKRGNAWKGDHP